MIQNLYTSSTNGFTHETMVSLSSYIHRPPILSLKGAKMRLGEGSGSQKRSKSENIEFLMIYTILLVKIPYVSISYGLTPKTIGSFSSRCISIPI